MAKSRREEGFQKMINGRAEHSEFSQGMRYHDLFSLDHVSIILMVQEIESITRNK